MVLEDFEKFEGNFIKIGAYSKFMENILMIESIK